MKFICKALLITFLASLPLFAFAVVVEGLYSATVEVTDQSSAQRQKGFSLALADVLIKTTGTNDITDHSGVSQALTQASNYMVKYAYLPQLDPVSPIESESLAGGQVEIAPAPPGFPLSVQFAKATVDELMLFLIHV